MEDRMFTTYKIGNKIAKNRIIRSATNDHLGNRDGSVSDAEIEMYDALARNEVGTIITGHFSVSPDLDYRADEVQLSIGNDRFVGGLRRIAAKIRNPTEGRRGNEVTLPSLQQMLRDFRHEIRALRLRPGAPQT